MSLSTVHEAEVDALVAQGFQRRGFSDALRALLKTAPFGCTCSTEGYVFTKEERQGFEFAPGFDQWGVDYDGPGFFRDLIRFRPDAFRVTIREEEIGKVAVIEWMEVSVTHTWSKAKEAQLFWVWDYLQCSTRFRLEVWEVRPGFGRRLVFPDVSYTTLEVAA